MKKNMICIVCPKGCHLTIEKRNSETIVTGNKCPKGEIYGKEELHNPKRVLCCVVRTNNPDWPCIPVRTSSSVPKKIIPELLKHLYSLKVDLPVKCGDLLLENFQGEKFKVIFTRSLPPDYIN